MKFVILLERKKLSTNFKWNFNEYTGLKTLIFSSSHHNLSTLFQQKFQRISLQALQSSRARGRFANESPFKYSRCAARAGSPFKFFKERPCADTHHWVLVFFCSTSPIGATISIGATIQLCEFFKTSTEVNGLHSALSF